MSVDAAQLWSLNHRLLTVVLEECVADLAELGLETKEFFVLAEVATSPTRPSSPRRWSSRRRA